MMLAKKYRLPIQSVIGKSGGQIKTPFFLIKIFSNQFFYPRFGVVISKKIFTKATKRNNFKRRVFSAVEGFWRKSAANKDILVIVSPRIKELKKENLQAIVGGEIKRIIF